MFWIGLLIGIFIAAPILLFGWSLLWVTGKGDKKWDE